MEIDPNHSSDVDQTVISLKKKKKSPDQCGELPKYFLQPSGV